MLVFLFEQTDNAGTMMRFVLLLILVPWPAFAQNIKAATLSDACKDALTVSSKSAKVTAAMKENARVCAGYVSGVLDANQLMKAAFLKTENYKTLSMFYCLPDGFTTQRAVELFVPWLEKNAKFREQAAANAIILALREAHPCH